MPPEKRKSLASQDFTASKRTKLSDADQSFIPPAHAQFSMEWLKEVSSNQEIRAQLMRSIAITDLEQNIHAGISSEEEQCLICHKSATDDNIIEADCSHKYHIGCFSEWALSLSRPWTTSSICLHSDCNFDLRPFLIETFDVDQNSHMFPNTTTNVRPTKLKLNLNTSTIQGTPFEELSS